MAAPMTDRLHEIMSLLECLVRQALDSGSPEVAGIAETARAIMALDGWRDISTAPKMPRECGIGPAIRILLRFGEEAVSVAYWDWYYAEGGSGFRDGFAWIEPCSGEPLNLHYSTPPDGWMPIPPAPEPQP